MAGILLLVGFLQFFIAVNIAETQFPDYSTSVNTLSDLSGTLPPVEPSATIFNFSIILMGVLIIAGVYLILKSGGCRLFSSCLLLASIGFIGIGLFPEYVLKLHSIFAFMAFFFLILGVIFSYRLGLNLLMVSVSMALGLIALTSFLIIILGGDGPPNPLIVILGGGDLEILIIYPCVLYLIALGGYLTSRGEDWVRIRFSVDISS